VNNEYSVLDKYLSICEGTWAYYSVGTSLICELLVIKIFVSYLHVIVFYVLWFWQSIARGSFGRQQFIEMRANVRATTIQRVVRGWLARRRYNKVRCGIIKLQAHVRRRAAKKELKRLKVGAYSLHIFLHCTFYSIHN